MIPNRAQAAQPTLVSVVIRGSSVYAPPELFELYRAALGKPVTIDVARAIVAAIAGAYERDGFVRPQIKVDDGLLAAGVLRIDVVEPHIGSVRISGDPGPHRRELESLGASLTDERPLATAAMQAALKRMRALPGLTLAATTERDAAEPTAYRLDLDAEFERIDGSVRLTNRGTDEAGPNFALGQLVVNGLLGGRASAGALFGAATDYDEYHGSGVFASLGAGAAGGRITLVDFASRSNPHERADRDDVYLRDRTTVGFARPLPGFGPANLTITTNLIRDHLVIERGGLPLRDERLGMIEASASVLRQRGSAESYASVAVVASLDALGSRLTALDLVDDPRDAHFELTRATFVRLARFRDSWSVRVDALLQESADVLPYAERFKIGGDRLGRGFEVAEIAGDRGVGAKVELRRQVRRVPAALGRSSAYGFYDIGATWKNDVVGRESAASAGFGFAIDSGGVAATLELAAPLTHADVEGRTDLRLFAELSVRF